MSEARILDRGDATKALIKMFLAFQASGTDTEKALRLEIYEEALRDLSPAEVVAVCDRAVRGILPGKKWMPTPAELIDAALSVRPKPARQPTAAMDRELDDVFDRETGAEMYRKLKAELGKISSSPLVEHGRKREKYDPNAPSFSPYRLGATVEQIKRSNDHYRKTGEIVEPHTWGRV